MNSQFTVIQQIYRIIAIGNVNELALLNNLLNEFLSQTRAFSSFSGMDDLHHFYSLYPKILDRLFGGNCTGYQDDEIHFQTNTKWIKGDDHGWLKALINALPPSYSSNSSAKVASGSRSNYSLTTGSNYPSNAGNQSSASIKHHFLQFFHPFHKVFHLLEKTKYELHLSLLPEKIQHLLHQHPLSELLLWNENSAALVALLLHIPWQEMKKQSFHRVRLFQEVRTSVSLDALEYFLVFLLRYPILSNQLFIETSGGFGGNVTRKISSLDLFYDVRKGVTNWTGSIPYFALLLMYLEELFPIKRSSKLLHSHSNQQPITSSTTTTNANAVTAFTRSFSTSDAEQYMNKYRQFFVQLVIAYWIDQLIVIRKDHQNASAYRRLARTNLTTGGGKPDYLSAADFTDATGTSQGYKPHPSPYEMTVLDPMCKWTIPTCQSLFLFLFHLQQGNSEMNHDLQRQAMKLLEGSYDYSFEVSPSTTIWRQLQIPVFDMLCYIFERGDESLIDREVVFMAIEIWLLWIQPWQYCTATSMGSEKSHSHTNSMKEGWRSPDSGSNKNMLSTSQIEQHWHYYIHANYHFYSTLFTYFLRLISKCNLSLISHLEQVLSRRTAVSTYSSIKDIHTNLYHEGNRYLFMLEKVLKVFPQSFCLYLDTIGQNYVEWYDHHYLSEEGLYSPGNHHSNMRLLARSRASNLLHVSESNASMTSTTTGAATGTAAGMNTATHNDSLIAMLLLKDHHYQLFPDRKIDALDHMGIPHIFEDAKPFVSTIFQNLQNQIDLLKMKKRTLFPELQAYFEWLSSLLFDDHDSESNEKIAQRLQRVQTLFTRLFTNIDFQQFLHTPTTIGRDSDPSLESFESMGNDLRGSNGSTMIRNRFTGKLTHRGKALAQQRLLQCSPKELKAQLVYSKDPLEFPIWSFEIFPRWTQQLIQWSQDLNHYYHFPKNTAYVHITWSEIYEVYTQEFIKEQMRRKSERGGSSTIPSTTTSPSFWKSLGEYWQEVVMFQPRVFLNMITDCFRFNLRFLGTYQILVMMNVMGGMMIFHHACDQTYLWLLLPLFFVSYCSYLYFTK